MARGNCPIVINGNIIRRSTRIQSMMRYHLGARLLLASFILVFVASTQSNTIPYRVFPHENIFSHYNIFAHKNIGADDKTQYILSIVEGSGVEVSLQGKSSFTLNLNRMLDQDVVVFVNVNSKDKLVELVPYSHDDLTKSKFSGTCDLPNCIAITYKAKEFGDRIIKFNTGEQPGHAEVICQVQGQPFKDIHIDDSDAFISINIHRHLYLTYLSNIVGWIYFFAWSISFYFQIVLNFKRKSVVGLNFDFIALNILGFACYTAYNASMLFSDEVRDVYYKRYTYTRIPVELNDLVFSSHALLMSLITIIQCFIYERGEQRVSITAWAIIGALSSFGAYRLTIGLLGKITIYDVVFYLSTVKLIVTLIKYTPQAFFNFKRKATTGWSIHNILLDFTGGVFSLEQMFVIAYNYNDWVSIFGNISKFGLAIFSIIFDIIFMVQHYILYKEPPVSGEDSVDQLNPVISESIRSASIGPQQYQPPTPGVRTGRRFAPYQGDGDDAGQQNDDAGRQMHLQRDSPYNEGFDNENFESDGSR